MNDIIPCTVKTLAEFDASTIQAAIATAIEINPANAVPDLLLCGLDESMPLPEPAHISFLTGKYWGPAGVRLTVGFLDTPDAALRRRIVQALNTIGQYGNVVFTETGNVFDAQVRIARSDSAYWSYLGTDILSIPRDRPTMMLGHFTLNTPEREWLRVVPHEGLHTCGCPHEHQRAAVVNRIDRQKAYAYFRQTQGWSPRDVDAQVLTPLNEKSLLGTPADVESIMAYALPGAIMVDGQPVPGGATFTESDKAFIGKTYPKAVQPPPEPPAPPLSGDVRITLDTVQRRASLSLPAGWVAVKASPAEDIGMLTKEQMLEMHYALAQCVPLAGTYTLPEGAAGLSFTGIISKIVELSTALRNGDIKATLLAARDLLNLLFPADGETILFQQADPALAMIDRQKLLAVLVQILPYVLGLLGK